MKEVDFVDFRDKMKKRKERKPLYGQIELTYKCSYNCIHCYCKEESKKELDFSFWKDVLKQVYDLGGIEVTFTGGDPLLYKDFLKVYKFAREKGFLINLFTAGYNFNKEILDFLKDYPPLNIEITINSLNRENYERIVQAKGTFDRTMENIQEIKKRGLPLVLKCNGLKENRDEILNIKKFTEELLGKKKFKFDSFIFPGLDRQGEPKNHRLGAEEIIEIERQDKDMLAQRKEQIKHQHHLFNPEGLYHCNSWFVQYHINPHGILQFCSLSKKYSTDLRKESFEKGFDRFLALLKEKHKTDSKCISCEYKDYCYHCPARAYLESGDEETTIEYYCQLAKATKNFMDELKTQISAGSLC